MLYVVKISKVGETNTVILSPNKEAVRAIDKLEVAPGIVLSSTITKSPYAVMVIKEGIDKIVAGMELPMLKLGEVLDADSQRHAVVTA